MIHITFTPLGYRTLYCIVIYVFIMFLHLIIQVFPLICHLFVCPYSAYDTMFVLLIHFFQHDKVLLLSTSIFCYFIPNMFQMKYCSFYSTTFILQLVTCYCSFMFYLQNALRFHSIRYTELKWKQSNTAINIHQGAFS